MEYIIFGFNAVLPIILLIFTGVLLKKTPLLDDDLTKKMSSLVFHIALPSLVFRKIAQSDIRAIFDPLAIGLVISACTITILLMAFLSRFLPFQKSVKGTMVIGSFWGNVAIIGFAIISRVSGDDGVALATLIIAFVLIFNNIVSITALSFYTGYKIRVFAIIKRVVKNPVVLASVVGVLFSYFAIPLPEFMSSALQIMGNAALPVALLAIGGSLSFYGFKKSLPAVLITVSFKVILLPLIGVLLAILVGLDSHMQELIFLILVNPTAIAFFVVSSTQGGDRDTAAGVTTISTIVSPVLIGFGIVFFRSGIL